MDCDNKGNVSCANFTGFFEMILPPEAEEFELLMSQLMVIAQACRIQKQGCAAASNYAAALCRCLQLCCCFL